MRLIIVALLVPLLSGCDSDGPIEVTHDADAPGPMLDLTSAMIQIPDAPRSLPDGGEINFDFRGPPNPKHVPHAVWLHKLEDASSWDVAVGYAAMAARSIVALPVGAQRQWYPRLIRAVQDISHLSSLVSRPPKPTREDIQDLLGDRFTEIATICFVGFDLPSSLDAFSDQAAGTFVSEPYWRQDCDVAEVRVLPITTIHNHYHLNFEDPDIDCIVPDAETLKMGRDEDGECVELDDYAAEPRMLGTMGGDEIIRIRAHDPSTGDPIPFDVASFANVSEEPVRFRYKTEAGQWFEWNSLGGPTNWGVSVFDAVEVVITNAGTSLDCGPGTEAGVPGGCQVDFTPFLLDEFVIGL
jgi:hypothetical protein